MVPGAFRPEPLGEFSLLLWLHSRLPDTTNHALKYTLTAAQTYTSKRNRAVNPSAQESMIATALVQPAEARAIFTGKQTTVKPVAGRLSRLCSFSRWQ
jgi:hypothetical protein